MASKYKITVALTEEQMRFLEHLAQERTADEGRKISPAEIVRRALSEHFGERWPHAELRWGDFGRARPYRWSPAEGDQDNNSAESEPSGAER